MQKVEVLKAIKAYLKIDYELFLMHQNYWKKGEKNLNDTDSTRLWCWFNKNKFFLKKTLIKIRKNLKNQKIDFLG